MTLPKQKKKIYITPVHVVLHKLKLNMSDDLVMEFWKQVWTDKNTL